MNRSKDLDTIASDDPVSSPNSNNEIEKAKIGIDNNLSDNQSKENLFSSFILHPKTISFLERNEGEEIYLALRPHWSTNLNWMIISVLMLFVPLFFRYFSFLDFFPTQYRFSVVLFWYLFTFIFTFEKFLDWYFDIFFITNQRLVDIDFNNLLNKHFAEADLNTIQDVSSSIKGLLGTFFNYGDVLIQTAAKTNQINFEKVPNPGKVIKFLEELRGSEENQGGRHV
jgi:hypothetical protein